MPVSVAQAYQNKVNNLAVKDSDGNIIDYKNPYPTGTETAKFFDSLSFEGKKTLLGNQYAFEALTFPVEAKGAEWAKDNIFTLLRITPPTNTDPYAEAKKYFSTEGSFGDFLISVAPTLLGVYAPEITNSLGNYVSEAVGGGTLGEIASGAATGAAKSALTGKDVLSGALTGGITGAITDYQNSIAEDYLNSLPGGYEIDAAPAPTEADVLAAIGGDSYQAPVIDTSFSPDYSLFSGNPVIPEMGAQGITAPAINEVIDVLGGVDYSLPIPDSGIGLVMPTAPNIDSMGGGQGITVPVSGGTLTESGVIPTNYVPDLGDSESFINQPAPDSGVVIQEPTTAVSDIDSTLAALDVAKALAPIVVGAIAADAVTGTQDTQTGYPILPIPAEWRSPEYNMAFSPDATNLFPDLPTTQQMQSAKSRITAPNQYQLSDVINTLNYQSVPFTSAQYQMPAMQQRDMSAYNDIVGGIDGQQMSINDIINSIGKTQMPAFGMSNIVGNLQGSPVSIGDIISGIQSQYGQTPTSAMG